MKKLPDVILASDGIYEKQALREADILNIKSYAIFNTNGDIDLVDNMVPANTNSVKSFDFIAGELKSAFAVNAQAKKATVKKVSDEKVSGEKKPAARKPRAKKEETTVEAQ